MNEQTSMARRLRVFSPIIEHGPSVPINFGLAPPPQLFVWRRVRGHGHWHRPEGEQSFVFPAQRPQHTIGKRVADLPLRRCPIATVTRADVGYEFGQRAPIRAFAFGAGYIRHGTSAGAPQCGRGGRPVRIPALSGATLSAALGCYRAARNGTTSASGLRSPISSVVRFATASAAASNTASAACT
jgi:hypothetical protein